MIFKILKTPGVGGMGHSPVEANVVGEGSPSEQRGHIRRPEQGWEGTVLQSKR